MQGRFGQAVDNITAAYNALQAGADCRYVQQYYAYKSEGRLKT